MTSDAGAAGRLTIGQLSRLTMLSVRMLRHYDAESVLLPAWVDPANGYRYYTGAQVADGQAIRDLRDAGCPIPLIRQLLATRGTPMFAARLAEWRGELAEELVSARGRIELVDRLIQSTRETHMPIEIRETTIPAYTCASLRNTIPAYTSEGDLWGRLAGLLAAADPALMSYAPPEGVPGAVAVFHDEGYREADVDVEIRWAMPESFTGAGEAMRLEAPSQRTLCSTLKGGFEGLPAISKALGAELDARGLAVTGPMFNIYVVTHAQDPDPANWVTEVCLPIG